MLAKDVIRPPASGFQRKRPGGSGGALAASGADGAAPAGRSTSPPNRPQELTAATPWSGGYRAKAALLCRATVWTSEHRRSRGLPPGATPGYNAASRRGHQRRAEAGAAGRISELLFARNGAKIS